MNGIDIGKQRARRFSPGDFDVYDKIYALAQDVLEEMKRSNIQPNVVTYHTIIDGFKTIGRMDKVQILVEEMKVNKVAIKL